MLCLCAGMGLWPACQEEKSATVTLEDRAPMYFTTEVESRSSMVSPSVDSLSSFCLTIHAGPNTLYDGLAYVMDGVVELLNRDYLDNDGMLLWPEDESQQVNIVAVYDPKHEQGNPMEITIGDDFWGVIPGYLPYTATVDVLENGKMTYDLLAAHVITSKNNSRGGVVNLNFKHLLTQVQVTVKTMTDNYYYRINGLSVTAFEHGAYRFSPTDVSEDGWMDMSRFKDTVTAYLDTLSTFTGDLTMMWEMAMGQDDGFWDATDSENYLLWDSDNMPYYDLGVSSGQQQDTLLMDYSRYTGKLSPLCAFVLPLAFPEKNFEISYGVWSTQTENGEVVPDEAIYDFSYRAKLPDFVAGNLYSIHLKLNGMNIEFVGDSPSYYRPE